MSSLKIIDFSGVSFTPENFAERIDYKIFETYVQEGYRHFALDLRQLEFGNAEGMQRIGLLLMNAWSTTLSFGGKCIIIRPQGIMKLFGTLLEGSLPDDTWIFVDSIEEAKTLIGEVVSVQPKEENIKIIDFANVPFDSENVLRLAGHEIFNDCIKEGYRHFILDLSQVGHGEGFLNPENLQRIGLILISSWSTTMDVDGNCIIVKPQGSLELFGVMIEASLGTDCWKFTNSVEEAKSMIED